MKIANFTEKELELIELLKVREVSRTELKKLGYKVDEAFFYKCESHNIPIYESECGIHQRGVKYGINC